MHNETKDSTHVSADFGTTATSTIDVSPDLAKAQSRVKTASVLAAISASLTTLFALLGFFVTDVQGALATYLDPWLLIDAAVLWGLALLMYQRSLAGSVFMIVYWSLNIVIAFMTLSGTPGLLVKVYFLYHFINGARGAYILRRANPIRRRSLRRKVAIWSLGGVAATTILILCASTILMEAGVVPSYEVEDARSMPARQIAQLQEHGVLEAMETIDLFYSAGITDIMEDRNIITNRRVISYWMDEDQELQVIAVPYSEISEVRVESKGDDMKDSILTVTDNAGDSFQLIVTIAGNGDDRFLQNIKQRITP